MLNTNNLLTITLSEVQLSISDILTISIPILCVLLTLLLTIFLNFLSDRRKLRYEIKKDSSLAYSNYFLVLKELQLTVYNKNYNVDTIASYITKLQEPTIIASKINENLISFYDLLVAYLTAFKQKETNLDAIKKYYKSHHLSKFTIFFKINRLLILREKKTLKFKLDIKQKEINDILLEIIDFEITKLNKKYRRICNI